MAYNASSAQRSLQVSPPTARELHIQKTFHLVAKDLTVRVPPDLLHAGHQIDVEIFCSDHLFKTKASMRAAQAASLDATMRSFADSEAGNYIIHHDRAGMN